MTKQRQGGMMEMMTMVLVELIMVEEKKREKNIELNDVEVTVISERVQYYDKDGKLITESITDYSKKNILE